MLERASITEQFSTFIELADERFSRWLPDRQLTQSMTAVQARLDENKDLVSGQSEFWSLYWYGRWKKENSETTGLAYGHLAAFVQEACYWAAQKTTQFSSSQYTLVDYFQIAIARFNTVLKTFSPDRGSRLETYAHVTFKNLIRETLRQQQEIAICSDWALRRRVSQKRLEEALRAAGERNIDSTVLVWRCFKVAYDSTAHSNRQFNQADADVWAVIVKEYSQQCLSPTPPSSDALVLQKTLRQGAAAVRAYLYPKTTSLNVARSDQGGGELQDTLANPETDSLLDAMVADEERVARQQQQAAIDQVLQAALDQLPDEAQKIFVLYYRENQTQQQIAKTLDHPHVATVNQQFSCDRASADAFLREQPESLGD